MLHHKPPSQPPLTAHQIWRRSHPLLCASCQHAQLSPHISSTQHVCGGLSAIFSTRHYAFNSQDRHNEEEHRRHPSAVGRPPTRMNVSTDVRVALELPASLLEEHSRQGPSHNVPTKQQSRHDQRIDRIQDPEAADEDVEEGPEEAPGWDWHHGRPASTVPLSAFRLRSALTSAYSGE